VEAGQRDAERATSRMLKYQTIKVLRDCVGRRSRNLCHSAVAKAVLWSEIWFQPSQKRLLQRIIIILVTSTTN